MDYAHIAEGIIFSGFLGLVIGNFVTNPIYRLPRQESLFLKDPYCGDCNAKLMPKDLFPVLSWLMTRGKCRYCGAPVPGFYTAAEALIGILFIICFLKSGFSESFILISFGMTAFVMIAAMLYIDNFFSGKTVFAAIALGAVYRTLMEGSIYPMAGGAFAGLAIGAIGWKLSGKEMIRDIVAFPGYMQLLCAAGIWLPWPQFAVVCLAAGAGVPLRKDRPWIIEWVIITCVILQALMLIH